MLLLTQHPITHREQLLPVRWDGSQILQALAFQVGSQTLAHSRPQAHHVRRGVLACAVTHTQLHG